MTFYTNFTNLVVVENVIKIGGKFTILGGNVIIGQYVSS